MDIDDSKECFNCIHFEMCYLRNNLWNMIISSGHLITDEIQIRLPGQISAVKLFTPLANACTNYDRNPLIP